jgi:hypothetical protein
MAVAGCWWLVLFSLSHSIFTFHSRFNKIGLTSSSAVDGWWMDGRVAAETKRRRRKKNKKEVNWRRTGKREPISIGGGIPFIDTFGHRPPAPASNPYFLSYRRMLEGMEQNTATTTIETSTRTRQNRWLDCCCR